MGAETGIAWTDHTFNPWWGCTRVSPGCTHCYAETWDTRWKGGHWGVQAPRRFFGDAHWNEPRKWNRDAAAAGVRRRVFCASMADVFEDRRDLDAQRERLWRLIAETPSLDWQLLTKRPENIKRLMPEAWNWPGSPPRNVWLGTTAENQETLMERWPHLKAAGAAVSFLSCEPLLGPLDFLGMLLNTQWVIVGGESGPGARPMDHGWARSIVGQCHSTHVPCFVKQLGGARDKRDDPSAWPADLRVREFPK